MKGKSTLWLFLMAMLLNTIMVNIGTSPVTNTKLYIDPTTAIISLDIIGVGSETVTLTGPTEVNRSDPYDPDDGQRHAYVDSFAPVYDEWSHVGTDPYLNATGDGNYIEGTFDGAVMAWFTFEDVVLEPGEYIKSVTLFGYTDGPYDEGCDFDIYANDFTWLGSLYATGAPNWVTPRWVGDATVSDLYPVAKTEDGLNGMEVLAYFYDPAGAGGPGNIIDALKLEVIVGDDRLKIDTEIMYMNLVGTGDLLGPVTIAESPSKASSGAIQQQVVGEDFPADSFFDVFIEIETTLPYPLSTLHNDDPHHLSAVILGVPPLGTSYTTPLSVDKPLKDELGNIVGYITNVILVFPTPEEVLQHLITTIESWDLLRGIEDSLTPKLEAAIDLLNKNNINGAVHILEAFINQVEAITKGLFGNRMKVMHDTVKSVINNLR
ncbi:MAG: hypothetical protein JSV85_04520 [Candidatus Bathyarchaeota archaeon]|nr:MAG: hypothetical protein JSV85_04520 [Candidatus Bathyarchaeota archaeon]